MESAHGSRNTKPRFRVRGGRFVARFCSDRCSRAVRRCRNETRRTVWHGDRLPPDLRKGDRFSVVSSQSAKAESRSRRARSLPQSSSTVERDAPCALPGSKRSRATTPDGRSLRQAFLRSPAQFSRVTSGFAMRFTRSRRCGASTGGRFRCGDRNGGQKPRRTEKLTSSAFSEATET